MKSWQNALWATLCGILAILLVINGLRGPQFKTVEKVIEVPVVQEKIVEKIVEVEKPEPTINIPGDGDLMKTSKGFSFRSELVIENGDLASLERKRKSSYVADYKLRVKVPKAAAEMAELESATPGLGSLLPGLSDLVSKAVVSDFYEKLYANKASRLRSSAAKLEGLLTAHNFYDCQTMLNLTSDNGRKVFLLQGDMDVVSDGSDGDRLPIMPEEIVNSTHYQATTSYGWNKIGETPNPLLAGFEKRLVAAQAELADPNVSADRKSWVRTRIRDVIEPSISEMKRRSFLIADYDPFIVIPTNIIIDRRDSHAPQVGDYAVVVHQGVLYPAIVGDAGPTFKVGEASLRMAKQIHPKASSYWRPVSDLTVTYICFPKTAEKPHRPPDYAFWRQRCKELLDEIGGTTSELFAWDDLLKKEEPAPTPGETTTPSTPKPPAPSSPQ